MRKHARRRPGLVQCSPQPSLGWPGYQAGGTLRPGMPGGARPNAQCGVDCGQMGIARSSRAPDQILSSSPARLFVFPI
jgi:hypothetical protein